MLRGKCSACGTTFSIRYALVEILTAAIYFTIYWRFGYTWETLLYILFFTVIIVLSFIDIDFQIIPNELLMISLVPVLVLLIFNGLDGIWNNLIGAVVLVGVFLLMGYLGKIAYKQDSMGMGDVKYAFVIGLLLGWKTGLLAVMLSFFAAAIMVLIMKFTSGVESRQRIPFGPFLSIGLFISTIWGNQIIEWYIGLLS